jgi:lincosamide nucleotidyltransferase A/C/D/E
MMTSLDVLEILDTLKTAGITVWLDGGWGIDALLGRETRVHDDLDAVIDREDLARAVEALAPLRLNHAADVAPGLPARFVLRDQIGRQVDFHLVRFDERRNGWQDLGDGRQGQYPAAGLLGIGRIAGRDVLCITPELQIQHHQGYEPEEKDRQDIRLLLDRFKLPLPPPYGPPPP